MSEQKPVAWTTTKDIQNIKDGYIGRIWEKPHHWEPVPLYTAPPAPEQPPVASIVPSHCGGSALALCPGVLHVNKDGSGYIAIDEDDFVCEDDRSEGPDGPEGSVHWIVRFDPGEMTAVRDFLCGIPLSAAAPAPEPVAVLDKHLMQKLKDALRFSASRSVMSAEDERRILSAIEPAPDELREENERLRETSAEA